MKKRYHVIEEKGTWYFVVEEIKKRMPCQWMCKCPTKEAADLIAGLLNENKSN